MVGRGNTQLTVGDSRSRRGKSLLARSPHPATPATTNSHHPSASPPPLNSQPRFVQMHETRRQDHGHQSFNFRLLQRRKIFGLNDKNACSISDPWPEHFQRFNPNPVRPLFPFGKTLSSRILIRNSHSSNHRARQACHAIAD